MTEEYAWLRGGEHADLGVAYCITYVRSYHLEALRRFGAGRNLVGRTRAEWLPWLSDTLDPRYQHTVLAAQTGEWAILYEANDYQGTRPEVLRALSRRTEAVSVFLNVNADRQFCHAVDGELTTSFDPMAPAVRYGSQPDRLLSLMCEIGLDPAVDWEQRPDPSDAALLLAARLTGVRLTPELLTGELVGGGVLPLLHDPPAVPQGHGLYRHARWLAELIDAAPPARQRAVAAAAARRLAESAGIDDHPPVAEALAAASAGQARTISDESVLGRCIRWWDAEMEAAGRANTDSSLTDLPTAQPLSQATVRSWAGRAVRAALFSNAQVAAYEALMGFAYGVVPWPASWSQALRRMLQG